MASLSVLSVAFATVEQNSCDRDHIIRKPKLIIIWPFIEKVC